MAISPTVKAENQRLYGCAFYVRVETTVARTILTRRLMCSVPVGLKFSAFASVTHRCRCSSPQPDIQR
jgi:hypothetical protein